MEICLNLSKPLSWYKCFYNVSASSNSCWIFLLTIIRQEGLSRNEFVSAESIFILKPDNRMIKITFNSQAVFLWADFLIPPGWQRFDLFWQLKLCCVYMKSSSSSCKDLAVEAISLLDVIFSATIKFL